MSIHYQDDLVTLHHGTAATVASDLTPGSVRTIVTSPPYFGLRDYGHDEQIGAEASVGEYVQSLVDTFAALRPALADDGTLWLNLGDSYSSGNRSTYAATGKTGQRQGRAATLPGGLRPPAELPDKNLLGVPWRAAFALQADGWILRSDIIWAKKNVMPESVTDRPTKAHEYLFLFAKRPKYYYDAEAIRETMSTDSIKRYERPFGGEKAEATRGITTGAAVGDRETDGMRNKRTVWTVATQPFHAGHFAVYPPELIRPCILAGSARGDTVLDPFSGSGTTGMVATQEGRRYVGIDVNAEYLDLSLRTRFAEPVLDLTGGIS